MYRHIQPDTPRELPLRMLFQPLGDGLFHRACEADSFRALVGLSSTCGIQKVRHAAIEVAE
jgi:hypothetical protein